MFLSVWQPGKLLHTAKRLSKLLNFSQAVCVVDRSPNGKIASQAAKPSVKRTGVFVSPLLEVHGL
jgi:hypothetical protein